MFLKIKGIRKSYGTEENRVEVLKGIDLEVEKGQICVLLGQSGSGKSTLLNIIGGIDNADSGYGRYVLRKLQPSYISYIVEPRSIYKDYHT